MMINCKRWQDHYQYNPLHNKQLFVIDSRISIILLLFFVLLSDGLLADEELFYPADQTIALWPQRPLRINSRFYANRKDNVTYLTKESRPSIELYKSKATANPTPSVIICPGGGYASLVYDLEGTEIANWLTEIGVTAVLLRYTVPRSSSSNAPFRDLQRAMSVVRLHAVEWNIDPEMVGVMGFSAGGHLAARLSTNWGHRTYAKMDEADDLGTRPNFTALIYPAYLASAKSTVLSSEFNVTEETPPTFIIHTKDDNRYVNGSIAYSKALEAADVAVDFHLYENGGHGFGLRSPPEFEVSKWPDLFEKWIRKFD